MGAQTAGAVCRTIPARFQLQEVSVGLESSKLRRRPAGRRPLQEALHNSSPAAAGTLDLESSAAKSIWDTKLLQENFAGLICTKLALESSVTALLLSATFTKADFHDAYQLECH